MKHPKTLWWPHPMIFFCLRFVVVIVFFSAGQNITGTLPTELTALPFLQSINLYFNDFTGSIPVEYAIRDLAQIQLQGNHLTGTIPSEFWTLSRLQAFNVGENMLSGTISTHLGLLTELRSLHTVDNMFTGPFPTEIGNLKYLSKVFWSAKMCVFFGPLFDNARVSKTNGPFVQQCQWIQWDATQ
mmetsp:Transcript_26612/g.61916  ORF Transcript_26612/g.61916 Transcript_26612/m.61916 type:complete len:185 (+) Transcript_26612:415-969(+)